MRKFKASCWGVSRSCATSSVAHSSGEMVFPWMFDEFSELHPFKEAAQILAHKDDWPVLYHPEALKSNTVPVAAACYYEDMCASFTDCRIRHKHRYPAPC